MVGKVIVFVCCLLCAIPFLIIAHFNKHSDIPINFWSGDDSLKDKVTNVAKYNARMAKLYRNCSIAFITTGICCFVLPIIGVILLCLECTVGIYIVYRKYKKILNEFS